MATKSVRIDLGDPQGLTLAAVTGGIEARVSISKATATAAWVNGTEYPVTSSQPSSIVFPVLEPQVVDDGTYAPIPVPTLYKVTIENGDLIELFVVRWEFRDNKYNRIRPERSRFTLHNLGRTPTKWSIEQLFVLADIVLEDR